MDAFVRRWVCFPYFCFVLLLAAVVPAGAAMFQEVPATWASPPEATWAPLSPGVVATLQEIFGRMPRPVGKRAPQGWDGSAFVGLTPELTQEYLGKLARTPLPSLAGLPFVEVRQTGARPEAATQGWLLRQDPDAVWLVDVCRRIVRVPPGGYAAADSALSIEKRSFLEWARARVPDASRPTAGAQRGVDSVWLFWMGVAAVEQGDAETGARLLQAAERAQAAVPWVAYQRRAQAEWMDAVRALSDGAPRRWVADALGRWLEAFPEHRLRPKVADVQPLLAALADQDPYSPRPPAADAPPAEKVRFAIEGLRDARAYQWSIPGECRIADSTAVEPFLKLGREAIPALIDALPDRRPTRSYGHRMGGESVHILRIGDAAVQILARITHQPFYDRSTTSAYLHNEAPEKREAVIAGIRAWWQKNRTRTERQWITDQLANPRPWYRRCAIRDLEEIAGKNALSQIRPMLRDRDRSVRIEAARSLRRLGDRSGLPVLLQIVRGFTFPPKPSPAWFDEHLLHRDVLSALIETREAVPQAYAAYVAVRGSEWHGLAGYHTAPVWTLRYLAPLLDNKKDTGNHVGPNNTTIRVCDEVARVMASIAPKGALRFDVRHAVGERDAEIARIRAWWKANARRYPPPPEALRAARELGLEPASKRSGKGRARAASK